MIDFVSRLHTDINMRSAKCVVCGFCQGKTFFTIPKQLEIRNKWLKILNVESKLVTISVCEDHFNPSDILTCSPETLGNAGEVLIASIPYKVKRLKPGSLPIPASVDSESDKTVPVRKKKTKSPLSVKMADILDELSPVLKATKSNNSLPGETATKSNNSLPGETATKSDERFLFKVAIKSNEGLPVKRATKLIEQLPRIIATKSNKLWLMKVASKSNEPLPVKAATNLKEGLPVKIAANVGSESDEPLSVEMVVTPEETCLAQTEAEANEQLPVKMVAKSNKRLLVKTVSKLNEQLPVKLATKLDERLLVKTATKLDEGLLVKKTVNCNEILPVEMVAKPEEPRLGQIDDCLSVRMEAESNEQLPGEMIAKSNKRLLVKTVSKLNEQLPVKLPTKLYERLPVKMASKSNELLLSGTAIKSNELFQMVKKIEEPLPVQIDSEPDEQSAMEIKTGETWPVKIDDCLSVQMDAESINRINSPSSKNVPISYDQGYILSDDLSVESDNLSTDNDVNSLSTIPGEPPLLVYSEIIPGISKIPWLSSYDQDSSGSNRIFVALDKLPNDDTDTTPITTNSAVSLYSEIVPWINEIPLPSTKWNWHHISESKILICSSYDYRRGVYILKEIFISNDAVKVKILGDEIPLKYCPISVGEFVYFLSEIDKICLCVGYQYYNYFSDHYYRCAVKIGDKLRHKKCPLYIPAGDICLKCYSLERLGFRARPKKPNKSNSSDETVKNTIDLNRQIRAANSKLHRRDRKIDELSEKLKKTTKKLARITSKFGNKENSVSGAS